MANYGRSAQQNKSQQPAHEAPTRAVPSPIAHGDKMMERVRNQVPLDRGA